MTSKVNIMPRRSVLLVGVLAALTALCMLVVLLHADAGSVYALKAAGLNASGGVISGVSGLFDTLKSNVVWIAVTAIPTIIVVVGLLFLFGHSRAQDYAMRIALGVLVIVAAPGIVK